MPLGAVPANDRWETRQFDCLSTATFVRGSFVKLSGARTVMEMTSLVTDTQVLGIAASRSTDSLPAGKILVHVPLYGAIARVDTGAVAASSLSIGQGVTFQKSGNTFATVSVSSVTRHAVVAGPLRSADSTIEVALLADAMQQFSTATIAI